MKSAVTAASACGLGGQNGMLGSCVSGFFPYSMIDIIDIVILPLWLFDVFIARRGHPSLLECWPRFLWPVVCKGKESKCWDSKSRDFFWSQNVLWQKAISQRGRNKTRDPTSETQKVFRPLKPTTSLRSKLRNCKSAGALGQWIQYKGSADFKR